MTKESNRLEKCPKCKQTGQSDSQSGYVLHCMNPKCPIHKWFPEKLKSGYYKTPAILKEVNPQ